ncbi:MAG: hypothetical protein OXU31_05960, partial [Gammaproteobacteria bacterium]|nr:hypothetical protein [Gammaproteobacteria bacterium]
MDESASCDMTRYAPGEAAAMACGAPGAARGAPSPVPSATERTLLATFLPPTASVTVQWAASSVPERGALAVTAVVPLPCVSAVIVAGDVYVAVADDADAARALP